MMSGAANCLWSVAPYPETAAYQLARDLDCSSATVYGMRECLMDKSVDEIVSAQAERYVSGYTASSASLFMFWVR